MSKRTALVFLAVLSACKPSHDSEATQTKAEEPAKSSLPPEILQGLKTKIEARQNVIKAWRTISVDGTEPCPHAPAAPPLHVNGFRTGSFEAEKSMTMVTAAEIDGKPDPSLPPDVAKDMMTVSAAGRGAPAPNGWAEIDYTTDALPFQAGPIAKKLQYEVRKLSMGESTMEPAKLPSLLAGSELVLVVEEQVRPAVNNEAHTFTPGALRGTALLYSYDTGAVLCAGKFLAQNEKDSFEGDQAQVETLPEEELELLAYRAAVASLHETP
ncbi:MAG TPA: hypothetical protein VGM90_18430 [Kofleriaceae bacterium]|jgi:hypothetical protein